MRDFWKPMPVSGKLIRELLLLFLLLLVQQSYAQRITRQYNNVSFSAALKDLNARQHKYTINFVYDELEDFRRVTKSIRNQSVPDAIMQLIGFYPIRKMRFRINTTPRLTNIRMRRSITICFASCSVSELVIATAYINTTTKKAMKYSVVIRLPIFLP